MRRRREMELIKLEGRDVRETERETQVEFEY